MNIDARRNFLKILGLGTGAAIIPATARAGETSTAIDPAAPKPKAAKNEATFNEGTWRAIAGVKGIPYQPLV